MAAPETVAELQGVCPGAALKSEAGRNFIDLPGLKVPVGNAIMVRDALLSLEGDGSYTSRLYLSEPIAGRGANWTQHTSLRTLVARRRHGRAFPRSAD